MIHMFFYLKITLKTVMSHPEFVLSNVKFKRGVFIFLPTLPLFTTDQDVAGLSGASLGLVILSTVYYTVSTVLRGLVIVSRVHHLFRPPRGGPSQSGSFCGDGKDTLPGAVLSSLVLTLEVALQSQHSDISAIILALQQHSPSTLIVGQRRARGPLHVPKRVPLRHAVWSRWMSEAPSIVLLLFLKSAGLHFWMGSKKIWRLHQTKHLATVSVLLFGSCHLILFVSTNNSIQIVRRQCCLSARDPFCL